MEKTDPHVKDKVQDDSTPVNHSARRANRYVFFTTLSMIAILVLLEFGLRTFDERAVFVFPTDAFLADDKLGYVPAPSFRGIVVTDEYFATLETDSFGFRRNPQQSDVAEKPILVLGDELIQGSAVSLEQTACERLHESIALINVVNAGVTGWSVPQYIAWFDRLKEHVQPAWTLIAINGANDFGPHKPRLINHWPVVHDRTDTDDTQIALERLFLSRSALLSCLVRGWQHTRVAWKLDIPYLSPTPRAVKERIDELAAFSKRILQEDTIPMIVYIPAQNEVGPGRNAQELIGYLLAKELSSRGIITIDATTMLHVAAQKGDVFFKDGNLTPYGHQTLADLIRYRLSTIAAEAHHE